MKDIGKLRNMTSIYLINGEKMLLLYRQGGRVVNDLWTGSAGGHFEKEELNDARACALRELNEELSVTEEMISSLSLRYVTLRKTKGEIRQNYYFFADFPLGEAKTLSSNEGIVKWFSFDETKDLPMPFTARAVVEHYLATGRFNEVIYGGVADGERVVFVEMPEFE